MMGLITINTIRKTLLLFLITIYKLLETLNPIKKKNK